MERAVHNYTQAACKALEQARDFGHVIGLLRQAKTLLLDDAAPSQPRLTGDGQEPECRPSDNVDQLRLSEALVRQEADKAGGGGPGIRAVFLRSSSSAVIDVLLTVIAPDWQAAMTRAQRAELLYPFYDACPAEQLLVSLSRHLDNVQPLVADHIASALVVDPSSQEAARQLVRRFLAPQASGLAELFAACVHLQSETGPNRSVTFEEVIASLATLPDKCVAHADVGAPPEAVVDAVTQHMLGLSSRKQGGNSEEEGISALQAAAEALQRMATRGHAGRIAETLKFRLKQESAGAPSMTTKPDSDQPGLRADWGRVAASWTDSTAVEKLLTQVLVLVGREDHEIGVRMLSLFMLGNRDDTAEKAEIMTERRDVRHLLSGKVGTGQVLLSPASCRALLRFLLLKSPQMKQQQQQSLGHEVLLSAAATWSSADCIMRLPVKRQAFLTCILQEGMSIIGKAGIQDIPGFLRGVMQGVTERLKSPIIAVRSQGMRAGRTLATHLSPDHEPLFPDAGNLEMVPEEVWDESVVPGAAAPAASDPRNSKQEHGKPPEKVGASAPESIGTQSRAASHGMEAASTAAIDFEDDDDDPDRIVSLSSFRTRSSAGQPKADGADEEEYDSDDSLEPYDMDDRPASHPDYPDPPPPPVQLREALTAISKQSKDMHKALAALGSIESLIRAAPDELQMNAAEVAKALLHMNLPDWAQDETLADGRTGDELRRSAVLAVVTAVPASAGNAMADTLYSPHIDVSQRLFILNSLAEAARNMSAGPPDTPALTDSRQYRSSAANHLPGRSQASSDAPSRSKAVGKTRVWGHVRLRQLQDQAAGKDRQKRWSNPFAEVALDWMQGILSGWHVRRHGVDLLNRDFLVLGHLLVTAGTFVQCAAPAPAAVQGSAAMLEFLSEPALHNHKQPFVRRCALVAASQAVAALPPARVSAALSDGPTAGDDGLLGRHLHWLAQWTEAVARRDSDPQCQALAATCLQQQAQLTSAAILHAAPSAPPSSLQQSGAMGMQDVITAVKSIKLGSLRM